ncbi:hypothetical protein HK101_003746 [Irineochytrium annulatum]|nr:hypothetical protein HK101_003746 [Irineochytrium annulatum]
MPESGRQRAVECRVDALPESNDERVAKNQDRSAGHPFDVLRLVGHAVDEDPELNRKVKPVLALNGDLLCCVIQALDPFTAVGRLALYACILSSSSAFGTAARVLWSSTVSLDNSGNVEHGGVTRTRFNLKVPTAFLSTLGSRSLSESEDGCRRGSLFWRWKIYLRSIRKLWINLDNWNGQLLEPPVFNRYLSGLTVVHVNGTSTCFNGSRASAATRWIDFVVDRLRRGRAGGAALELSIHTNRADLLRQFFGRGQIRRLRVDGSASVGVEEILKKCRGLTMLRMGYRWSLTDSDLKMISKSSTLREFEWDTVSLSNNVQDDKRFPAFMTSFRWKCNTEGEWERLQPLMRSTTSSMRAFDISFQHAVPARLLKGLTMMHHLKRLTLDVTYFSDDLRPLLPLSRLYGLEELSLTRRGESCIPLHLDDSVTGLPKLRKLVTWSIRTITLPKTVTVLEVLSIRTGKLVIHESLLSTGMPNLQNVTLNYATVRSVDGKSLDQGFEQMLLKPKLTPYLCNVKLGVKVYLGGGGKE